MSVVSINKKQAIDDCQRLAVSLRTLAQMLDADRASVRRWLKQAGVRPIAIGRGRNGAIRYKWREVQDWVESQRHAD